MVAGNIQVSSIDIAAVDVEAAADTIRREIRVCVGQRVSRVDIAGIDLCTDTIAGTEKVVLIDRDTENYAFGAGKTGTELYAARRFFRDVDVQIDLVGRAGNCRRFHIHILKELQTFKPLFGAIDFIGGIPGRFKLPHLAAQHFVPGARVAGQIDAAHIDAATRIDKEGKPHRVVFLVHIGDGVDVGKGVTVIAESIADGLARFRDFLAVEELAGL